MRPDFITVSLHVQKPIRAAQNLAETRHGFLRRNRHHAFRVLNVVVVLGEGLGLLVQVSKAFGDVGLRRGLAVKQAPDALELLRSVFWRFFFHEVGEAAGAVEHEGVVHE